MQLIYIAILVTMFILFVATYMLVSNKKMKEKRKAWEENIHKQVINNLEQNNKRAGLWRIAMNESNGAMDICKPLYIKYCVQSIIGEHEILDTIRL